MLVGELIDWLEIIKDEEGADVPVYLRDSASPLAIVNVNKVIPIEISSEDGLIKMKAIMISDNIPTDI